MGRSGCIRFVAATLLAIMLAILALPPAIAQDDAQNAPETRIWEVFVQFADDSADLTFVDLLTGESQTLATHGERFTLLADSVIYFDRLDGRVKTAGPGGDIRDHPFISPAQDLQRIDWIVSPDLQSIAWTLTLADDDGLRTRSMLSGIDGGGLREVLRDGPWRESRLLPVAFSADKRELIFDAHPHGIAGELPYRRYANLIALDLGDGSLRALTGRESCFCPSALGDDILLRLRPNAEPAGLDVLIDRLDGGESRTIPAPAAGGFTQPGAVIIAGDGPLAVYVLSEDPMATADAEPARSLFVQLNLQTLEQEVIGNPINGRVYPLRFGDGGGSLLFTNAARSGAWKLRLTDGRVSKVAEALYLGRLGG